MTISNFAKKYNEKMFPNHESKLLKTDPEFVELFDNFTFDEVTNQNDLDGHTKFMAVLATLIGCQGIDEYKLMLEAAYNFEVTPIEMKEIVYQSVAYLGIGRVRPFLDATNYFLTQKGIKLPLEGQSTTNKDNRVEKGNEVQVKIFGEGMKGFQNSGDEDTRHINYWLAGNCFGDYYTRTGLNYKQREMITVCFLLAQGGCETQLKSHILGNFNVGNDKEFLIKVVSQCMPFIGYPRTLNAINCIKEVASKFKTV
ncbi:carboxymuconolactone decarboxylase family protein [Intestinibacter bartlettii]|uniref:Carboxymuconolactone decarboxylase family protein n=1 Tax=Intestinibacter bartlettii TaxID=261299 RepID=A0ABS6DXN6_9FIRM|nr:carboxymuconolactone decarboxylase family protein [Intestinibacter bartlettii]MBU5336610.1 carboxymuconolactone decarboxylase family protein [Intestinibacter bartlettii]MDO5010815.1 carboxymuconolactone decarboxylase family protein [Intestinibacter bartlettii]